MGWGKSLARSHLALPSDQPLTPRLSGAGSLRRELEEVLQAATPDTTHHEYRRLILEENAAHKGSASMRTWVWKRLKLRYVLDPQVEEFRTFFLSMRSALDPADRGLIAMLMMARTDRLFREVTREVLAPLFSEPGQLIDKPGLRDEVASRAASAGLEWSDSSINGVTSHILSSLKDFGVLAGSTTKRTLHLRPGSQVAVFAARLGRLEGLSDRKVLESQWFQLLGLSLPAVVDLMYMATQEGGLQFRFQADVAEIQLPPVEAAS